MSFLRGFLKRAVVAAVTTFDAGSGSFVVPEYNVLTEEAWGPGGCSGGCNISLPASGKTEGTNPGNTTLGAITANGGQTGACFRAGTADNAGATVGGTASGGNNTNTAGENGNQGGQGEQSGHPTWGDGGSSPNGGAHNSVPTITAGQQTASVAGNVPGGGARSGMINANPGSTAAGGAGGGYGKSIFIRGAVGSPAPGSTIAWAVGAQGTAGTIAAGTVQNGALGAAGRVRFTVA